MTALPDMLRQQAVAAIRRRIVGGDFAFGERLSDRSLAAALGIGRTPVREALATLAREGLVTIRPRSGTVVMNPDAKAIRALCEMRGVLECGALRLAAGRDPDRLAAALAPMVAGATLALEDGELVRAEALDRAFHEALVATSDNPLLVEAYAAIAHRVDALRHRLPRERGRMAAAVAGHRRILDLALAGRIAAAEAELAGHVRIVQGLASGLLSDPP